MSAPSRERFQSLGTAIALIISVIATVTSIYEANIMKTQQKAMVWPYLDLSEQYNGDGFGIEISNKGTGPAIVTSVQVDFKNTPIANVDILMDSLNPNRTFGYDIMRNSTLINQVFMSGETKMVFGLPYNDETRVVLNNMKHVRMRVGYKSVLDDYWMFDTEEGIHVKQEFKATQEFKN